MTELRHEGIVASIRKKGQAFVDEPVHATPVASSPIARSVRLAFGSQEPRRILLGYERVWLNWITPPKGTP